MNARAPAAAREIMPAANRYVNCVAGTGIRDLFVAIRCAVFGSFAHIVRNIKIELGVGTT
jgi:hypothetical protein